MAKMAEAADVSCMTGHPGFEPVALNKWVLQSVHSAYFQDYGRVRGTENE
jgi:hypothetical protein